MADNQRAGERPSVFVSYARDDDEPFVKRLHNDLIKSGIHVWWDRKAMEARGRKFLQEIRDAIEGVDRVVVVIGPRAVASEYVRYEWEHASLFAKAVVPILRLGDYHLIPDEILPEAGCGLAEDAPNKQHAEDFRDDERYGPALGRLINILGTPVPDLGSLDATPALPPHFLPRRDDVKNLQDSLLADVQRPTVIISAKQTVALQGMGGIGKSVLAAAFARTTSARRAFYDGVVWLTAGQKASRVTLFNNMKALGIILGDDAVHYANKQTATTRLFNLLRDKVCLIVLDDVWSLEQVEPFRTVLGPRCRLLVTTRDSGLVTSLGAQELSVEVLRDEQALSLLAEWSGQPKEMLPTEAKEIAQECGNLPLALAMVGALVHDNPNRWANALHRLRHAELDKIKQQFPNYPHPNLLRAIEVSVDALEKETRERYLDLAIFPEDTPIPEATLQTLWGPEGLDEFDTQDILDLFVNRSLARRQPESRIILHDLQLDYVRKQAEDLPARHDRFVQAYRAQCGDGWVTGPNDGYFFQFLSYHLYRAGRTNDLKELVLDVEWLRRKRHVTSYLDAVLEYEQFARTEKAQSVAAAIERLPSDSEMKKVELLRVIGRTYDALGERHKEHDVLIAALQKANNLGSEILRASVLTQLGICRFYSAELGAKKESRRYLSDALKVYEKIPVTNLSKNEKVSYVRCLNYYGIHLRELSEFKKSAVLLKKAARIAGQIGDHRLKAHAIANIGAIRYWKREYKKALECWERSLDLSEQAGDKHSILHYTIDIGYMTFLVCHFEGQDDDRALLILNRGIEMAKRGHFYDEHARGLMNKASLLFARNELDQAEELYRSALKLAEQEDIARLLWRIEHNLANLYCLRWFQKHRQKDRKGAEIWYDRAREDLERQANQYVGRQRSAFLRHRLNMYRTLILRYLETDRIDKAKECAANSSLDDYLIRRKSGEDLLSEERRQKNYNFFDIDGFQCYIETE